jgi:hypothetical protein
MNIPDRIQLHVLFDHLQMCQDLKKLKSTDWLEHFVKDNFEGDWSIIPLRGPKGETHPIRMSYSDPSQNEFVDTIFLKKTNYFPKVIKWFKCPVKSVRLMKLSAGSTIKKHSDLDLSVELGEVRLHIPIKTNADVHFYLNDSEVTMNQGECWYLRLSEPHNVDNESPIERIHLVLDVVVNKWLEQQLHKSIQINNHTELAT